MTDLAVPTLRAVLKTQTPHYTIADVGDACGVSRQAAAQWAAIPLEHIEAVSRLLGKHPSELRPDIFTKPKGARKK